MRVPPLVRALRPRQWVKNVLVLAAPLAAGELAQRDVVGPAAVAFACFCAVSSAGYLVNDLLDRDADRLHPVKALRPLAAGEVSPSAALVTAAVLATTSVAAAWVLAGPALAGLLAGYLVLQVAYSLWLKHEPVLDLVVVASGFLARAVAGGIAADLPLSQWFLLVSAFGSLFIVAGKRYSELRALGADVGTRRSLVRYSDSYLRFVWSTAAGATLMAYSLWAFEQAAAADAPWHTISIAPFLVGLLRYAVRIDEGVAGEPEDIVFGDRGLQLIGLVWLVTVVVGILDVRA